MKASRLSDILKENYATALMAVGSPFFYRQYDSITPDPAYGKNSDYSKRLGPMSTANSWNFYHMSKMSQIDKAQELMRQTGPFVSSVFQQPLEAPDIEEVKIQQIIWDIYNLSLNVFLQIRLKEGEFWAEYKMFNDNNRGVFTCELFTDPNFFQTETFRIQLKGLVKQALYEWFRAEEGIYTCVAQIYCQDEYGTPFFVKENTAFSVVSCDNWWSDTPTINIVVDMKRYTIKSPEYYQFKLKTAKT